MVAQEKKLMEGVRHVRETLGQTQQEFAVTLRKSYPSVQRYERVRPPKGPVLNILASLAEKTGNTALAELFRDAYAASMTESGAWGPVAMWSFTRPSVSGASNVESPQTLQVPAQFRPSVDKLAAILNSSDQAVIDAVTQNIDVFYDRLREPEKRRKPRGA
jgi:transcriptional regulator with XRE-family HTH domain